MNYKGIIFDLDGTLADTLEDIAGSMNRTLAAHHYPILPVNNYKLLVGRGLDNLVLQALPAEARQSENVTLCLAEMMEDYDKNCIVSTRLYTGIHEMLQELMRKNIQMAVFSNKAEVLTIKIVNRLLADIPFIHVMGARSDIPKKPDPWGALLISQMMKVSPENLIYTGDSDVDMNTAISAGMKAVGVSWGFRSREELQINGADLIIDHPRDILSLFKG